MLWKKGWLETRFRLLFVLGYVALTLAVEHWVLGSAAPRGNSRDLAAVLGKDNFMVGFQVIFTCALLAGAGIATQASLQTTKGLHGSTQFTLSLPVSRLRLLIVRAAIGWLVWIVAIGLLCFGSWLVSPALRTMVTPTQMSEYGVTLILSASVLYGLSVFLGTFLDDQWRTWGTLFGALVLWWLCRHTRLPAAVDIFQALGKNSILTTHTVPWAAMGFSVVLAAAFFFAALKVVQSREY